MMWLTAKDGMGLGLGVVGYEFPEKASGSSDANWLLIEGQVRHPRGMWRFCDPCLRWCEAAWLGDWLEAVAAGTEPRGGAGGIEPNLEFRVETAATGRVLLVTFRLEALPPWMTGLNHEELRLPVRELDLARAVADWRADLQRFAERTPEYRPRDRGPAR